MHITNRKVLFYLLLGGVFILGLFTRFGMIITPTTVYLYFTFASILFIIFILSSKTIKVSLKDPLLIIFLIAMSLSAIFSPYRYGSFIEILRILSALFTGIVISNLIESKKELKIVTYYIAGLGISLAAISYLFYYSVEFAAFPYLASLAEKYAFVYSDTLSSIWQYQNAFGGFLVLPIFILFHQLIKEKDTVRKLLWSFITIFLIFTLIITDSRGAMLVFITCTIIYLFLFPNSKKLEVVLYSILVILGAYVLAIFAASPNTLIRNFKKTEILAQYIAGAPNSSLAQRVYFAKFSLKMLLKYPLFGSGLGTFKDIYCIYSKLPDKIRFGPHSIIFRFITETGIIGITAFLILIFKLFKKAFIFATKNAEFIGIFIGILGLFLHMCIDIDYPDTIMLVLVFGILYAFQAKEKKISLKTVTKWVLIISIVILSTTSLIKSIAGIYAMKGNLFIEQGKRSQAIKNIETAIQIDNRNDLYHYIHGNLLRDYPTVENSLLEFRTASNLHKEDYDYPLAIGKVYLDLQNEKSIEYLKGAEKLYPTKAEIKGLIAIYYAWINKDNNYSNLYVKKTLALNKSCSNAYVAKGFEYLNQENLSLAQGCFRKAAKLKYNNPYAQLGFLMYYRKTKDKLRELNTLKYLQKFDKLLYESIKIKNGA